jgi:hypothetical protein
MTSTRFAATPDAPAGSSGAYEPGVCNIGPEEIARRRRAGHVGALVTYLALAALLVLHAPSIVRLVLVLPAAAAASGYLQAWLRFCAGFGSRGIFNFGALGETSPVVDAGARARDRARATRIGLASLAIGIAVAVVAVLLPGWG